MAIDNGEASVMDENGEEQHFSLFQAACPQSEPENDLDKLVEAFEANEAEGGEKFYVISVATAPIGDEGKEKMASQVMEWKEGKQ
jgi:hypothetical protein